MDIGLLITLGVVAGVVVILALVAAIAARMALRIASPSEALIITGKSNQESQRVVFGRTFINPISQRAFSISLASRQVTLQIEGISKNGIKLHLTGVAQIKVGGDEEAVRRAAQRFLNQQDQIDHYTQETLSGSLRSIVGTLTVDSIIKDRASFAKSVKEEAEHSMHNQGLVIDTFQIQSVNDDSSYLHNLGRPEAALAEKLAKIAEANAAQEAAEAAALADEQVALAEQRLAIRRAELKEVADARQAQADAAGPLAAAEQQQAILLKEQEVTARRAELRERELDIEIRKPADADKYRVEQEAAALLEQRKRQSEADQVEAEVALSKRKLTAEGDRVAAEAEAAASTARGNAAAAVTRANGAADAEVIKVRGEAEADVVRQKGIAEAQGIEAQARAYEQFNDAAVLNKVMEMLPLVAREVAAPMSAIDNMTVISSDGASQLSRNVTGGLQQTFQLLKDTTGLDAVAMLRNWGSTDKGGNGTAAKADTGNGTAAAEV
ncbi:flotillin family protein [Arthrobacter sp. JZ12]|uniref:flotillin family protein n=1 Tax=Arthrobacter sp. JZ12 TaxID=2654190 RepID=UPI002B467BCC|nr:SPFH domain-containing protein [Arthrobacter sp. JZ12]WRH23712.1 flotillin family protein [Arthrobacter sp. JZ12]